MPVIAPARNAVVRPLCRLLRAASAVRTLARTETFMPMKPVAPDRTAPSTKAAAETGPRNKKMMAATTTPTMAMVVYWRREVGAGAFLDRGGDLDHPLVAGGHAEHLAAGDDAVEHRDHAADHGDIKQVHEFKLPRS